jgi:tripartite-type tricarboxylate transporter receptor subunit TctC
MLSARKLLSRSKFLRCGTSVILFRWAIVMRSIRFALIATMLVAAVKKRQLCGLFLTATLAFISSVAYAQTNFPTRRIHVIVPYPAGGIVDIATRIVTDKLSEMWHQPIIVETKPTASGNLAWDQVSRAEPDGYTWVFLGPGAMANPYMYSKLRWDQRSFVPIGAIVWGPSAFVVHPSLPVNTLTDFIDYVRTHPGTLNWSNPGSGTSQHLNTAIFLNATKLNMVAVPYGGQPPGLLDLMANRVQFALATVGLITQHVNSGAMKSLAVLGATRSPLLPGVPTVSEAGYPEVNVVPWYGYGVPSRTQPPVVDKIVAAFNEVMKVTSVRAALEKQALQPMEPMTAREIADLYAADTAKYAKVIREANIRLSD